MAESNYPHKEGLDNLKIISPLISIMEESKNTYVKENLSQHLHFREIQLLRKANSHSKPMHKKARIANFKKLSENPENLNNIFELHKNIFIQRYQKLENKGLVEVNTECEDLPFDVTLTQKGNDLIEEIKELEKKWNDIILEDMPESEKFLELLKEAIHKAAPINHEHKKRLLFTF